MNKKLTRSNNKMLAGVCGGIAEYFDLDPTVIRAIWAIGTILTLSLGILAYIALCLIMPQR